MKEHLMLRLIIVLTVLASCGETERMKVKEGEEQKNLGQKPLIEPCLIDYKSDIYKISIGEHYKKGYEKINWRWDGMADDDGSPDSTGRDAFLYLSEPRINYNGSECLPSLHISTDHNIITSFSCSVLFELDDVMNSDVSFLKILSKDIKRLRDKKVVDQLIKEGRYEIKTEKVIEVFQFTRGKDLDYDSFTYSISAI